MKNKSQFVYYHNPRCSKSRAGLEILQSKNLDFKIKEYLKESLSVEELSGLFQKLNLEPEEGIRKNEAIFKELNLTSKKLSQKELLAIIVKNPVLLERPILLGKNKAVIGRPPEKLLELLD